MLTESARIAKVEEDAIWVVAVQKSACGGCSANRDCGTGALAEWLQKKSLLRVALNGKSTSDFRCDDEVLIGIPEEVVLSGTALLYVMPLLAMLLGAVIGHWQFGTDMATALFALTGLFVGGYLASRFSARQKDPARLHPVLLEHTSVRPV